MKRAGSPINTREGSLALTAVDEDVATPRAHASVRVMVSSPDPSECSAALRATLVAIVGQI
jgi:hypothetical protein